MRVKDVGGIFSEKRKDASDDRHAAKDTAHEKKDRERKEGVERKPDSCAQDRADKKYKKAYRC